MRRRIAAVFAVALIATPAAIALAAENETKTPARIQAAGLAAEGERQLSHARANLIRERRAERRRRARRLAKREGTTAAAGGAQGAGSAASPQLEAIAACESGGNPSAIGGGGQFRGKYQFTYETWAAVGGSGDPAAAPEAEQDRRAAMLLAQSGTSPWPVCGG
jgi:hypothetical protein